MFRFLTPRPGDRASPLQSRKAAAGWFRQLPAADRIGRSLKVIRALDDFAQTTAPADAACLSAVAYLDLELGPDRGQLIAQYIDRVDANPAVAERVWKAAYDINQAFVAAYRKLLEDATAAAADSRLKREIVPVTARLIHYFNTDAKLRALKSERWIPQKWAELHRLYRRAVELAIERAPPPDGGSGDAASRRTIEQEYIAVLLTHLVNAGTLGPSQIGWVLAQVHAWCRSLRLEASPAACCPFFVDPDSRRGLVRCGKDDAGPAARYLDTTPMAIEIEKALAALRRSAAGEGGGASSVHRQRITVLEKLRAMIAPDTTPTVSREPPRQSATKPRCALASRGSAELAGGFAGARRSAGVMSTAGPGAVPLNPAARSSSQKRPAEFADAPSWWCRTAAAAACASRWPAAGRDRSRWERSSPCVRAGGDWALGVVRRMVRSATDKVDVGVSVIALRFSAVELHAKRQAREDMGFVVDGIDVSTIGERFDGLYLPPPSRPSKALADKSIVIAASEYAAGRSVVAIAAQVVYTIVLRELIERHGEWCWVAIEIVDRQKRG
jgi:hypothetical protein